MINVKKSEQNSMVRHDSCPLCSSVDISLHLRCTDYSVSREEFDIFRCGSCNFLFTREYPSEEEISKYYESEDYISHSNTSEGIGNKLYHIARGFMLRRKRKLVAEATGIGRGSLLDIGTGTGYFANSMSEAGWKVTAIEPGSKARETASRLFGLEVSGPEKIGELPSKSFDCITLWHVLEHFHDPMSGLSEIRRMLKDEGACILALPNSGSYDAEHYGKFWAAWDVPRHLWHFDPSTITVLAGKAGLSIKQIKQLPLDVFYISMLSERYSGSGISLLKGFIKGKWFFIKSLFAKHRASSLVYILGKSGQ